MLGMQFNSQLLGNRIGIITILICMQNCSLLLKCLGHCMMLHGQLAAGPHCVVNISFIFHSFRVLFGTDFLDLLSPSEQEGLTYVTSDTQVAFVNVVCIHISTGRRKSMWCQPKWLLESRKMCQVDPVIGLVAIFWGSGGCDSLICFSLLGKLKSNSES